MPITHFSGRTDRTIIQAILSLRRDQRGGVAIMMGLLFPVLLGVLAIGFEVSNWYLKSRSMQNAADAAAVAAASNGSDDTYNIEAAAVAAHYGFVDGTSGVTLTASNEAPCPEGTNGSPCYSVTISSKVPLFLSQFVGYAGDTNQNGAPQKQLISAAVAVPTVIQQPLCLLALSQSMPGIRTNGAPNSNFSGCSVMSDSTSTCDGSNLQATYGLAHGSNDGCGVKQKSDIPLVPDPYAALAINIPTNTCSGANPYPQEPTKKSDPPLPASNRWSGSKSFSGAVQICGDVQLTSDVMISTPDSLTGATLVIENGQLDLNGHTLSTANGAAITIVFSGTAGGYVHIPTDNSSGQGGVLNFQAPSGSTALFPGIAIYQDPSLTTGVNLTYKGNNPAWDITGAVYLPNANVTMSGDVNKSSNGADCFVMVAKTVLINGTSNIYAQTPSGAGCRQAGLNVPTAQIPGRSQLVY
jgi:Flp pilus assembly protein TadG